MKLNRRLLILATTGMLASGVQAQTTQGVSDNEIVIGTHIDLSGPAAPGMPMLRNGMQLRIDELNAAGGSTGARSNSLWKTTAANLNWQFGPCKS